MKILKKKEYILQTYLLKSTNVKFRPVIGLYMLY